MTPRHTVRADDVALTVAPQVGAKVVSLRRAGRPEWLAPPVRPVRPVPLPAGPWSDQDCSGWDECFPNIAADERLGLTDHGDVWPLPWSVESAGPDRIRASVTVDRRYRFTRELHLGQDAGVATVTADYWAEALGAGELQWAWAQHALLAARPAMRLVLPAPARVRVDAAFAGGGPSRDVDWLCPGATLAAVTSLGPARGRAAKLWFEPPLPSVVVVVREHDWLAWRVDRSTTAHLGLWVNLGGWGDGPPLAQVAVEPAFGGHDSFALAQREGAGPPVPAGRHYQWRTVLQTALREQGVPGHPN